MSRPASAAARAAAAEPLVDHRHRRRAVPVRRVAPRGVRRWSGPAAAVAEPASVPDTVRPQPRAPARSSPERARRVGAPQYSPSLARVGVRDISERLLAPRLLLARLVRGRTWIGVLAFALVGIVTMQVLLLRLNTGIGRDLQRAAALQREDATASIQVSEEGAPEAIEAQARAAGMITVPPGGLHFLAADGFASARRAAQALRSYKVSAAAGEIGAAGAGASSGASAGSGSATVTAGETATSGPVQAGAEASSGATAEAEALPLEQGGGESAVPEGTAEASPSEPYAGGESAAAPQTAESESAEVGAAAGAPAPESEPAQQPEQTLSGESATVGAAGGVQATGG